MYSELSILILSYFTKLRLNLDSYALDAILIRIANSSVGLAGNVKFVSLIMTILTNYSQSVRIVVCSFTMSVVSQIMDSIVLYILLIINGR